MYRVLFFTCVLLSTAQISAGSVDQDLDAAFPVPNVVAVMGADDLQNKMLEIDGQVLLDAITNQARDANSYTIVSRPSRFCVYSNNRTQGLRFLVEPQGYMDYSAADFGLYQEANGGSRLQFYNQTHQLTLPFFLIVTPNAEAVAAGMLGEHGPFTVGATNKPPGSRLEHLQAGVWEEIDHYDIQSVDRSKWHHEGCPGTPVIIELAVLNKDLVAISSGNYVTSLNIQVDAID